MQNRTSETLTTAMARVYTLSGTFSMAMEVSFVRGMALVSSIWAHILFDIGASRSCIFSSFADTLDLGVDPIDEILEIGTLLSMQVIIIGLS